MTVDWGQAVLIFVLGMVTVFVVLILLWGILAVMGMIFNKTQKADNTPSAVQATNSAPAVKTEKKMSAPKKVASAPPANEDELVAVLNAAAVGYTGSANVRVKSYKKM